MSKDLVDRLEKEFGKGIISDGNAVRDRIMQIIPVSPVIDQITGGGFKEGDIVVLSGPPKVGKSVTALHFAANAQNLDYVSEDPTGRNVYYFSTEGRLQDRDVKGIPHLVLDKFHEIRTSKDQFMTAEIVVGMAEKLIHEDPGCVIIIDSISQLCAKSDLTADIGDQTRPGSPMVIARFLKRTSGVVSINRCILICITHLIENQGNSQKKWNETGGQKIKYMQSTKLRATHKEDILAKEDIVGQKVHWICENTSSGSPNKKGTSIIRYGKGIDKESEVIEIAQQLSIIKKGGAWYTLPDESKFQGIEKTRDYLEENPELYKDICEKIKDYVG